MGFKKTVSILTVVFFTHTTILVDSLLAITSLSAQAIETATLLDSTTNPDDILPTECGRVVERSGGRNDILMINIQDLHCNPEVQRNITKTLRIIEEHAPIAGIFVEGAPQGPVPLQLLSSIPDETLRAKILDALLGAGILSGAEYYAVTEKAHNVYGLEDWPIYQENADRLKRILMRKHIYINSARQVNEAIDSMRRTYVSRSTRRVERMLLHKRARSISKYYVNVSKMMRKYAIDPNDYPNIDRYIRIAALRKSLKGKPLKEEVNAYASALKSILPYGMHTRMLESAKAAGSRDAYYTALARLSRHTSIAAHRYPLAHMFFELILLGDTLNPAALHYEEGALLNEIVTRQAAPSVDRDMLFLTRMGEALSEYAACAIEPQSLTYFLRNKEAFKTLYAKYAGDDDDSLAALNVIDDADLSAFYACNRNRDAIFARAIDRAIPPARQSTASSSALSNLPGLSSIDAYSAVYISITGGFHSGMRLALARSDISWLNIMPTVTSTPSGNTYETLMTGNNVPGSQKNAYFGPMFVNLGMNTVAVDAIITTWAQKALENTLSLDDIRNDISRWMRENNIAGAFTIEPTEAEGVYKARHNERTFVIRLNNPIVLASTPEQPGAIDPAPSATRYTVSNRPVVTQSQPYATYSGATSGRETPYDTAASLIEQCELIYREHKGHFDDNAATMMLNYMRDITTLIPFVLDGPDSVAVPKQFNRAALIFGRMEKLSESMVKEYESQYRTTQSQGGVSSTQRELVRLHLLEFVQMGRYSTVFKSAAIAVANLELCKGYRAPAQSMFEKLKIYSFIRGIYGFSTVSKMSEARLRERVALLRSCGNDIVPSLYDQPSDVDTYINNLKQVHSGIGIAKRWAERKALQRSFTIVMFAWTTSILLVSGGGLTIMGASGIIIALAGHHAYLTIGIIDLARLTLARWNRYERTYDGSGQTLFYEMLKNEQQATLDGLSAELTAGHPSADIILLLTSSEEDTRHYQTILNQSRGFTTRTDVPVVVIPYSGKRDGTAMLEAVHFLTANGGAQMSALAARYPHLAEKTPEQLRAVIVKTSPAERDAAMDVIIDKETFRTRVPAVQAESTGRDVYNIDYQIMHAYKATQQWQAKNRGGWIYVDAAVQYEGPIRQTADITLLTSWAGLAQITRERLGVVREKFKDDKQRALTLLYFDEVQEDEERIAHTLRTSGYQPPNQEIRSNMAFTRTMLFSFNDSAQWQHFIDMMESARTHILASDLHVNEPGVSLTAHIINPLMRKSNGENIFSYLAAKGAFHIRGPGREHISATDAETWRENIIRLFDIFENGTRVPPLPPFSFDVYTPSANRTIIKRKVNTTNEKRRSVLPRFTPFGPQNNEKESSENENHRDAVLSDARAPHHPAPPAPIIETVVEELRHGPLSFPGSIAGPASSIAETSTGRQRPDTLAGASAIFVMEQETPHAQALMTGCAKDMNVIGVSPVNNIDERKHTKLIGRVVVPVGSADILVHVRARPSQDGKFIRVYLEPAQKQVTPQAGTIAAALRLSVRQNDTDIDGALLEHYRMLLLGRGTLAMIRELQSGLPRFKRDMLSIDGLHLPFRDVHPSILHVHGAGAQYAFPDIVMDDASSANPLTADPHLNTMVTSYYAETLAEHRQPVVHPSSDLTLAVLAASDAVVVESNQGQIKGIAEYPGFETLVTPIDAHSVEQDAAQVLRKSLYPQWSAALSRRSVAVSDPGRQTSAWGESGNATRIAADLSIHSFDDIVSAARMLAQNGTVDTITLPPLSLTTSATDGTAGTLSAVGMNLSYISWATESHRLLPRDQTYINTIRDIVNDPHASDTPGPDGLTENQFYAGLSLYQEFIKNPRALRAFERFKKGTPDWNLFADYARFLAAARLLGRLPVTSEELRQNGAAETKAQWILYPQVYEYLQYVAMLQLREAVRACHKLNVKVLGSYTPISLKASVDVLCHPDRYRDGQGHLIPPVIDGTVRNDIALHNWHRLEDASFAPVNNALKHWMSFGFDGMRFSGLRAYDGITEAGFSADKLFAELAATARSIHPDATLAVEPYGGKNSSRMIFAERGVYTTVSIPRRAIVQADDIRFVAGQHANVWFSSQADILQKPEIFEELVLASAGSGVPAYCSFSLNAAHLSRDPRVSFGLSDVLRSLQYKVATVKASSTDTAFVEGAALARRRRLSPEAGTRLHAGAGVSATSVIKEGPASHSISLVSAPRLHVFIEEYRQLRAPSMKNSLLHKAQGEHVFERLYTQLNAMGLTDALVPEIWLDVRQLHRRSRAAVSVEDKSIILLQLYGYISQIFETTLYQQYEQTTRKTMGADAGVFGKLLAAADVFSQRAAGADGRSGAGGSATNVRTTLMAFSGVFLSTNRLKEAHAILLKFASYQRQYGTIPGSFSEDGRPDLSASDTSLWFIEAVNRYYHAVPHSAWKEVQDQLLPAVNGILAGYLAPEGQTHLDGDLLTTTDFSTGMDSPVSGATLVPRGGKPVELQALLYNALRAAATLNNHAGDKDRAEQFLVQSRKTAAAINDRFFSDGTLFPYDVIDGNIQVRHDMRPHALLLMSLSETASLLPPQRQRNILNAVEKYLYTPYGLRSLEMDSDHNDGTRFLGAAWPYYLGHYLIAKKRFARQHQDKSYRTVQDELRQRINTLLAAAEHDTLPTVFGGTAPYTPEASDPQSILSVAGLLESMTEVCVAETPMDPAAFITHVPGTSLIQNMLAAM